MAAPPPGEHLHRRDERNAGTLTARARTPSLGRRPPRSMPDHARPTVPHQQRVVEPTAARSRTAGNRRTHHHRHHTATGAGGTPTLGGVVSGAGDLQERRRHGRFGRRREHSYRRDQRQRRTLRSVFANSSAMQARHGRRGRTVDLNNFGETVGRSRRGCVLGTATLTVAQWRSTTFSGVVSAPVAVTVGRRHAHAFQGTPTRDQRTPAPCKPTAPAPRHGYGHHGGDRGDPEHQRRRPPRQ
jgi:hypothetical protein